MVAIGLIIVSMRGIVLSAVLGVVLCSCGHGLFKPARATPPPLCAPFGALGSVQLDFNVVPATSPPVTSAEAERAARAMMAIPETATTCSVRLARYDNLSVHVPTVWVVQLDGLEMSALGGSFVVERGPQPSPPVLRRALVIVSTETPTLLLSIAMGE
jgi:hypothetical protein